MAKINIDEIFKDRLIQIDKDIKIFKRKKNWRMKELLEREKIGINKCLNGEETKEA